MSYQEQLNLLDDLSRGRKAKGLNHNLVWHGTEKYQYYHRLHPKAEIPTRSTKAMYYLLPCVKLKLSLKFLITVKDKKEFWLTSNISPNVGKLTLEDQDGQ